MRIKIDGYEPAHELRALAAMLLAVAEYRGTGCDPKEGISETYAGQTKQVEPVSLTDGDTAFPFDKVVLTSDPVQPTSDPVQPTPDLITPAITPLEAMAADPPAKRTRAKRAATQLQLVPTMPVVPYGGALLPANGSRLELALTAEQVASTRVSEVPAAPLVPAAPAAETAPAVTVPAVPVAEVPSAPVPSAPAPVAPVSTIAECPKNFPEFMRAVSPALTAKKITGDDLAAAVSAAAAEARLTGVDTLQGLVQNQSLVPAVFARLRTLFPGAGL
jgi:hypothetical protein